MFRGPQLLFTKQCNQIVMLKISQNFIWLGAKFPTVDPKILELPELVEHYSFWRGSGLGFAELFWALQPRIPTSHSPPQNVDRGSVCRKRNIYIYIHIYYK